MNNTTNNTTGTENKERIIDKIRKVLALSKNNPSKAEAEAAALKAQKLLAQYHIEMADIEDTNDIEEIAEEQYFTGKGNKWKYSLASIVARNFRCKHYTVNKAAVVFYGYETDAKIAKEVFVKLFEDGKRLANREYSAFKRDYGTGEGIKNSFYIGYTEGIKSVLEKQCTALMIVVPEDVEDAYKEKSKDFKKIHHTMRNSNEAVRQRGFSAGRSAMQARAIAG